MLPYIILFGRAIGSYALCAVAGILIAGCIACHLFKQRGIGVDDALLILLPTIAGVTIGGSLLYGLTNMPQFFSILRQSENITAHHVLSTVLTCFGGLVFYGGFLGGLAALRLSTKQLTSIQRTAITDIYAITVPLFHTFGRVGCFLGGCCYGIESRFGFLVTDNPLSPDLCGVVRFPVQLVEAAGNLLLFFLLMSLYRRERFRGSLLVIYLLMYPPMRFMLEFLRGDTVRGIWGGLSTSQWISLVLFAVAVAALIIRKKASDKS